MTPRAWVAVAGLNGFAAIALGAAGAHAVNDPALAALSDKASLYQLVHAAALLALADRPGRLCNFARLALLAGVLLFCGSLYGKAFCGWPAGLAPFGGMALMLGWLLLAGTVLRRSGSRD